MTYTDLGRLASLIREELLIAEILSLTGDQDRILVLIPLRAGKSHNKSVYTSLYLRNLLDILFPLIKA